MAETPITAHREKVSSFVGKGCFIQAAGLLAPFILWIGASAIGGFGAGAIGAVIGLVLLIVLFVYGSRAAFKWRCGNCRNPLADKDVRVCPVCRAHLS